MENSSQSQISDQDASNSTFKLEVTVWCVVFAAETVAIVIGNLLTVIIFAKNASVRKPSSYLIISLALADLFIGLFNLPLWIYLLGLGTLWQSRLPTYHRSITVVFLAIDIFTNLASISNMAAISLERLYATLLPWRHRATSRSRFLLAILFVWMMCAISSAMYIVASSVFSSALGTMYSWLPYFCLMLLVICASYTAILVKMRRGNHRRLDRERKLTMTLFIATVFSLVAHLPMVVLGVLYFALGKKMSNLFMYVLSFFNFGNSLVNPILYSFRIPGFRRAVCSMFCLQHQRQQTRPGHVTTPPADDCVASLSFGMTAISPTKFRVGPRVPDPVGLRTERQNQKALDTSGKNKTSTQSHGRKFVTDPNLPRLDSPRSLELGVCSHSLG